MLNGQHINVPTWKKYAVPPKLNLGGQGIGKKDLSENEVFNLKLE